MTDNENDICQTCLSKNRFLYSLCKLTPALNDMGIVIRRDTATGVCWECRAIIMKFMRFKLQAIKAQNNLTEILKHHDLKCLSRLSQQNKVTYDLDIQYCDPLNNSELDNKEIKKEETGSENFIDKQITEFDIIDSDYDKTEKNTFTQKNIIKNSKQKINRLKTERNCSKLSKRKKIMRKRTKLLVLDDDVKDKFRKVVFTQEDMLKNREDKRNQPNFKKIPYKCETCVLGFTRIENFNLHMEKKHNTDIGTSTCDVCQSRFNSIKSLERHRRKHYVVYHCQLCEYETLELWSVVSHCRVKHSGDSNGRIHCPQCSAVLRSAIALSEHVSTQHSLRCNECGDKFKGKHTLRAHKIRIHGVKRDFGCDVCGKSFKTKSRLESHIVGHNASLAKKLAFCAICNVQYKNIYVYRNHLKNSANHSERMYECKECKKKFASKVYWRKHCDFYHLHKSQYKCEICNKLFISDWRLKNHRQTHHGLTRSRNHTCNVCGKKFFTLSTLRGHQLTHSEQRSYMCEDCGDTFKQRPALYTHSRLVHRAGKRPKQDPLLK
ncbi:zinc finger protein 221-like [Battus philenor]|uniref:zinc finger protein 221-like n=1 Tax=Battus philenor TaxID=42288 RepID=UPI0035D07F20